MSAPSQGKGGAPAPGGPLARAEKETGRIEAFSDGVFAIAMTLLVLDLKVPRPSELPPAGGLSAALLAQWPTFLAYLNSFATILVMWVNHHVLFGHIKRTDQVFLFLNGLLLLFVTFVPYPTALLAAYFERPEAPLAAALYAATFVVIAVAYNLLWWHASAGHRLLDRHVDPAWVRGITRQYWLGPPLYALAFVLAFISVPASAGLCFLLALFFCFTGVLPELLARHRRRHQRGEEGWG